MTNISIKSTILGLLLAAGVTLHSHAVEIGLGGRLGYETEFTIPLQKYESGTFGQGRNGTLGAAMQMGVFADIGVLDWLAITPGINVSLFRGIVEKSYSASPITGIQDRAKWRQSYANTFAVDFDVLAKLMFGNWYGGVGAGVTFVGAPKASYTNLDGSKVMSKKNEVASHLGLNLVLDTGVYIPLMGSDHHHLITGVRATFDMFSIFKNHNQPSASDSIKATTTPAKMALASPFTLAFNLGYLYKF
jgi:hypothetical protein